MTIAALLEPLNGKTQIVSFSWFFENQTSISMANVSPIAGSRDKVLTGTEFPSSN